MSEGIVKEIHQGRIIVEIICQSACLSCHQKDICALQNAVKKNITVETPEAENYKIGEKVTVELAANSKAVSLILAYILPLALILGSLGLFSYWHCNDTQSALGCLVVICGYYGLLKWKNKHLQKHILFTVHRISVD